MDTPVLDLRPVSYGHPDAVRLVEEVQAEYVVRYGGPDGALMEDAMFAPPAGAFFVAFLDGEPVGTGAWRITEVGREPGGSTVAEIKRMYVRAGVRRTGVARAVLAHLESTAAAAGAEVLVLETGLRQPEAIRLYESSGYRPVTPFGYYKDYPNARHLGKRLVPPHRFRD